MSSYSQRSACCFAFAILFVSNSAALSAEIEFNRDIRPILSDNCFFCHGPDAAERKADLRLDTEDGAKVDLGGYAAIVAGKPDTSELISRILDHDPDSIMPPPDSERTLSDEEKDKLKRWIEQGAEWQQHWSFEAPVKRDLPIVSEKGWPKNEVDQFVLHRIDKAGMKASPEAAQETLLRRITLDLTGLPPTLAELENFQSDTSENAFEKVVDRLMKSPRFAERMTWQWLEAARYADTDGYQNDGPREMWRWRDWVIEAYRRNLPFDQFTVEQLAGDLLPEPTEEQLIATGFNRNHRYNSESGLVLEEFLLENAVDRVDTTSTVWMGLTVGCARCHDHKYDPISQKEYYQLVSFFDKVPESGRAIKMGNSEPWIKTPTSDQKATLEEKKYQLKKGEDAFAALRPQLDSALAKWEVGSPKIDKVFLDESLSDHFAVDKPVIADGKAPVSMEKKVSGISSNQRLSIAFRMTPETVAEGAVLSNEIPGTTRKGFMVWFKDGHLRFSIISRWIAGVATSETVEKFSPGKEVHITLSNDGTQRTKGMQILVDGEPVETRAIHNTNSNVMGADSGHILNVGGSKHLANWKGQVADLRFYAGKTLLQDEVQLLAERRSVSEVLALAAEKRSPVQQRKLEWYFIANASPGPVKKAADSVRSLRKALLKYEDSLPTTMVMEEAQSTDPTWLRVRGEYHNKGEVVEPGVPDAFPELEDSFPENRLGFAKWLVSGEHPLTSRVTVNRYWQMLFGTGLVKTAEDFGSQGSLPSHPDLLDWLAVDFEENGWDIRSLLKKMVMSATYRQSSEISAEQLQNDPENHFLARAPRLKLSGNALRDQALLVSNLLVEKQGGPSVKPYQPARLWKEASNFTYKQDKGENLYRRSLYTYWKRTLAPPSMAVLDTADREWCSVRPKRTNTPLQALTLMNETAFVESARKFGERVLKEGGEGIESRVKYAFKTVTSRNPSARELEILKNGYTRYLEECGKDPKFTQKITKVGESVADKKIDPVELGAATALANMILNLEEVSVRE